MVSHHEVEASGLSTLSSVVSHDGQMTFEQILLVVNDCECKDLNFHVMRFDEGAILQVGANVFDHEIMNERYMYGRKWLVPGDSPESDIVRTVFLAVMTWEEHEIRENFRYNGRDVFSPHFEVMK